jgi:hypothetical protein
MRTFPLPFYVYIYMVSIFSKLQCLTNYNQHISLQLGNQQTTKAEMGSL